MLFQIQPRTDTGYKEQNHHEPRVNDILETVVILHFQCGDLAEYRRDANAVVHKKHMVKHNEHHGAPADIVEV